MEKLRKGKRKRDAQGKVSCDNSCPMEISYSSQLSNCTCCPRQCGVDRLAGKVGWCRVPAEIWVSHAGLHHGEEPPISGTRGSGTIFFTGCNLKCVFCQNYQISQEYKPGDHKILTVDELALEMLRLQEMGAHNINFVSPSHMIFQMADAVSAAKKRGLTIPILYNSNGYDSVDALRQINRLVDIYLPDIKYLDNSMAQRYSGVGDYAEVIPGVLREMFAQVGHLEMDKNGIATRGLLVRHLVLPGWLENSRKCLKFLAELSPDIFVSIMAQYSPQHRACEHPEINRTLRKKEYGEIVGYALDLGLENAFVQEVESRDEFLPDFDKEEPFEGGN